VLRIVAPLESEQQLSCAFNLRANLREKFRENLRGEKFPNKVGKEAPRDPLARAHSRET
jgi:hypothetical protein